MMATSASWGERGVSFMASLLISGSFIDGGTGRQ